MDRLWRTRPFWAALRNPHQIRNSISTFPRPTLPTLRRLPTTSSRTTTQCKLGWLAESVLLIRRPSHREAQLVTGAVFFLLVSPFAVLPLLFVYLGVVASREEPDYEKVLKNYGYSITDSMLASSGPAKRKGTPYFTLLDKHDIRLLVVQPGNYDDDVRCTLSHVALSRTEDIYDAVSYAWGNSAQTDVIYISDETFPVTETVYLALKRFRYTNHPPILWIDSLCIDQGDIEERNQQVQLMADIYAKANRVVVWLGESSDGLHNAFETIRKAHSYFWYRTLDDKRNPIWHKDKDEQVIRRMVNETCLTNMDWKPVNDLLSRPWFQRLWVVQEITNSRRPYIVCGEHKLPWTILGRSLWYLAYHGLATELLDHNVASAAENVAVMEMVRDKRLKESIKEPWFNVALASSCCQCSDPRDRVLAVMSMAKEGSYSIFDREVTFDYSLDASEFYKRFALWDILQLQSLRSLSCTSKTRASAKAPSTDQPINIPSWVPDWTSVIDTHLFVRWNELTGFSAGGKDMHVYFTNDKNTLNVKGTIVGTLDVVGSSPKVVKSTSRVEMNDALVNELEGVKEWVQECQSIAAPATDSSMSPHGREAFWRTMMCDLTGRAQPVPEEFSEYFDRYMEFINEAPEMLRYYLHNEEVIRSYRPSFAEAFLSALKAQLHLPQRRPPTNSQTFHQWFNKDFTSSALIESSLHTWSTSRRFSRTNDGRLARVPDGAHTGDFICVLHGSEVPYVLRAQEDGAFTVVGECYAHGIMHGEALKIPDFSTDILRIR
jgi:Heterokaryon incompatibility protein (HET)